MLKLLQISLEVINRTFFAYVVNYTCICVHACACVKRMHTCVFNVFKTVCVHVYI